MKRLVVSAVISIVGTTAGWAINTAPGAASWWGYTSRDNAQGTAGDFIIGGSLGKGGTHGTYDDEWAVIGVIANKIVEHGGYFCPYQVQCANTRGKKKSWTEYYHPNGASGTSKCSWLCEPGYSGTNCMAASSAPVACDTKPQNTSSGGKFSGVSMKTSGARAGMCETEIIGFDQWGSDPECDVILGVVKFLEHGVVAAPVMVCCGRDNWRGIDSFVSKTQIIGDQKVLCAEGYKVTAAGSDCEPISGGVCQTQNMTMCANFERSGYDESRHTIDTSAGCVKYFCSEDGYAFPSAGNTSCTECATGVKGGPNPSNGVCVKCDTGQYYDKTSGTCKPANAYAKTDMQYGKGKTKNTAGAFETQCWTLVQPDEYWECVRNGGEKNQ